MPPVSESAPPPITSPSKVAYCGRWFLRRPLVALFSGLCQPVSPAPPSPFHVHGPAFVEHPPSPPPSPPLPHRHCPNQFSVVLVSVLAGFRQRRPECLASCDRIQPLLSAPVGPRLKTGCALLNGLWVGSEPRVLGAPKSTTAPPVPPNGDCCRFAAPDSRHPPLPPRPMGPGDHQTGRGHPETSTINRQFIGTIAGIVPQPEGTTHLYTTDESSRVSKPVTSVCFDGSRFPREFRRTCPCLHDRPRDLGGGEYNA